MGKLGLIIEGGGMKCAYSAGILDKFLDYGITFDYIIGVSAGSANACSFAAGQRDRCRRFYTEHLKDPMYFGLKPFLKTGNLFNLSYIYGTLSNSDGKDPLDYEAIMNNPAELTIVATNARTGKPHYFTKDQLKKDNYREVMASSAIPAVCRPVKVNGVKYFDGGISDSIPVQKALDDGCDRVVILMSKTRDFVKTPEKMRTLYTLLCWRYPNTIRDMNRRHIMYRSCQAQSYRMEKEGTAFIFAASRQLNMSTYTMDPAVEQELYDLGIADFETKKEGLFRFIGDSHITRPSGRPAE